MAAKRADVRSDRALRYISRQCVTCNGSLWDKALGDHSLTMHARTKSNAISSRNVLRILPAVRLCTLARARRTRAVLRARLHGAAQHLSPESSTCDQTTRAALGSTSAPPRRVAPPLSVARARARQVGWACAGHPHPIAPRSSQPSTSISQAGPEREAGAAEPGLSRDARGRGGRGACGSSCSSSRYTCSSPRLDVFTAVLDPCERSHL